MSLSSLLHNLFAAYAAGASGNCPDEHALI
ncbi:conserved hypothetical protein [Pseudomonas sp. 8AS]|jgi:hypothetical protein|nr:conserved hypothetical protein [Pseudomonas sp. 8AS]